MASRRVGFAAKVLGREGLPSHDTRRWQSEPTVAVSIEALHAILAYLAEIGIDMYRLSSDFVPYATHPDLPQFHDQVEGHPEELRRVGKAAKRAGVRLSLHPSQYVVLNAEDEEIRTKRSGPSWPHAGPVARSTFRRPAGRFAAASVFASVRAYRGSLPLAE